MQPVSPQLTNNTEQQVEVPQNNVNQVTTSAEPVVAQPISTNQNTGTPVNTTTQVPSLDSN